jgi:hypothetical protein
MALSKALTQRQRKWMREHRKKHGFMDTPL